MTDTIRLEFDHYYHIYNRGNNRETIFREERNYHFFLQLYTRHLYPVVDTFAYCLLPNHFHFLVRVKTEEEILVNLKKAKKQGSFEEKATHQVKPAVSPSQSFSNLFNAYAKSFNKTYQRTGSLFEKPFHRKLVDEVSYLQRLYLYIHFNPQKHGLIDDYRLWPYSSYSALISSQPTRLVRTSLIDFFGSLDTFKALQSEYVPGEFEEEFY